MIPLQEVEEAKVSGSNKEASPNEEHVTDSDLLAALLSDVQDRAWFLGPLHAIDRMLDDGSSDRR